HYTGQNLLARSLHPRCYQNNPGFLAFKQRSGFAFEPIADFDQTAVEERQALYQAVAEKIWSVDRIAAVAGNPVS
ncbi:MAG: hypothetical protein WB989_29445, partial [Mycobacterium sp.]